MWTTSIQNNCTFAITANGVSIAPSQSQSIVYVATGVSIQVPGIGQIQALEAGFENPGPSPSAVKLVSGNFFAYWGYQGNPTLSITVAENQGQIVFSAVNGPQQIAVQRSSPDNVFPAPSLYGDVAHDGVNLFTGDVNQSFPLAEVADGRLSYTVSAFYNSRSAGVATAAQDNVLAGNGWKLLDYPKIAQEGAMWYFLDGMACHLLTLSLTGAGYVTGGDYHAWRFINAADGSSWKITDDRGYKYTLANKTTLASGRVVWHLSSITDITWPSSVITVTYNGNSLVTIANSLGDVLTFSYDAGGSLTAAVHGVVPPSGGAAVTDTQTVLGYSSGTPKQLEVIQQQAVLPTGGVTPVDAAYLFQYAPANDPAYPLALAAMQSPLGAVMRYTYYGGSGIAANGTSFPWHPVIEVKNAPQSQVSVAKGLFYSFANWAFDATQTYIQWNLAKEYAGGVYASIDDDSPEDPYGHTSYLFFTGQPAGTLINYSGDATVAADPSVLGKIYWTGNFEVLRTTTIQLGNSTGAVGSFPGTLVPLPALPAGALVTGVSCTAGNPNTAAADIALDLENAGEQIEAAYQKLDAGNSGQLQLALHCLGPVTHVRAWSFTASSASMSNLQLTYIVPPPSPSVPPITSSQHKERVLVTASLNPVAVAPGNTFSFPEPYANSTSVIVSFSNVDGLVSTLTVTCFDANNNQVGSGTLTVSARGSTTGTVTLSAPAQVASIKVTSSASNTAIQTMYLEYLRTGELITDDALAFEISTAQNTLAVGRPGIASFAKTIASSSSVDGVAQSTTTAFGDDDTLPYPVTATQTVVNPNQAGGNTTVTMTRQITYAVQQYPALAENNILSPVAEVIDSSAPGGSNAAAIAGGVTQWKQWGSSWDQWRQYQLQSTVVSNGFAANPDASWLNVDTINARNSRGKLLSTTMVGGVVKSTLYDTAGERNVASFVNADVTAGQCGWIGFESYESMAGWTLSGGAVAANQAYTGAASYSGTNLSVSASSFTPRGNAAYVVAAWVLINPGGTATIGFNNNGTWSGSQSVSGGSAPAWFFIEAILNAPAAQQLPAVTVSSGAIDHVVYAPADAEYEAGVWNLSKRQLVATVGMNGDVTRSFYDATGTALAAATPGKSLSLIDQSFSSVLGQLWLSGNAVYNDAVPNQSLAVRTPHDGVWDDFTSSTRTTFPAGSLTNLTMAGQHALTAQANVSSSTAGFAYAAAVPSSSDFVVCAEVLIGNAVPQSGQSIGITVRASNGHDLWLCVVSAGISLIDVSSGLTLKSSAMQQLPPSVVLTLVVRQGNTLYAYADGMFLFSTQLGVSGPAGVRTTLPGSGFFNFGLVQQPELANSSQDGDGAQVQFIASADATTSSVSQSLYGGNLQLYSGRTLATSQTQASLAPVAGFASLDASTMTVSGGVTASWPAAFNTSPFAESLQRFTDPSIRPKSRGKAGVYTAGQQGSVSYLYGEDTDGFFQFPQDQLNTNTTDSPTGAQIVTYSNRNGILFGKARIDPATNSSLLTGYEYDAALRRTAIFYPAAYATPTSAPATFVRSLGYDFAGNPTQLTDVDSGTTRYAWDSAGRQRLVHDALAAAANPQYSVYTKYDGRGRIVEQGLWTGDFTQVTQSQLDDPTWPQQNTTMRQKLTWDTPNKGESLTVGRLTAAATPAFTQWFLYDARGLPIEVISNASFLIADLHLGYDQIGRLTSLTEGASGYDVVYGYDEQGRLISVGTSSNPAAYATYSYGNGVVAEILLGGAVTRTFKINALGDVQSITDDFFSETLFFDQRADGSAGYLNGQIASAVYTFNWSNAPQGYTYDYTYDGFGRLTIAANAAFPAGAIGSAAAPVSYDKNGNIVSMTRGANAATAFTYTAGTNQVSGQGFVYDARGSVVSASSLGITAIGYTPDDNRPLSATTANGTVQYLYDAQSRRVQRQSSTQTIAYLRDASGRVLFEKIVTAQAESNVAYVYGLRGRIAMIPQDGSGNVYAVLTDHAHSTRVIVNQNKQVVAWFNYDPYGLLLSSISNAGTLGFRYLYAGAEFDSDLQLYELSARFYDPALCRFYAPDPLHQFASPYTYSDNPVSFEDPTGEWFGLDDLIATVGGALIGGGLELAREVISGEDISWKKIAVGAAVGAVVGEAALYTAGGSVFIAGGGIGATSGAAIGAAATTVGTGIATGAAAGAAIGGAQAAISGDNILKGIGLGAVSGAQSGFVTSVAAPIIGARIMQRPVAGALTSRVLQNQISSQRVLGALTGAGASGVNSVLGSVIQGRSLGDAGKDLATSIFTGGLSGAFNPEKATAANVFKNSVVRPARNAVGRLLRWDAPLHIDEIELQPLLPR